MRLMHVSGWLTLASLASLVAGLGLLAAHARGWPFALLAAVVLLLCGSLLSWADVRRRQRW